jgi:hypothetical protein
LNHLKYGTWCQRILTRNIHIYIYVLIIFNCVKNIWGCSSEGRSYYWCWHWQEVWSKFQAPLCSSFIALVLGTRCCVVDLLYFLICCNKDYPFLTRYREVCIWPILLISSSCKLRQSQQSLVQVLAFICHLNLCTHKIIFMCLLSFIAFWV